MLGSGGIKMIEKQGWTGVEPGASGWEVCVTAS